MAPKIKQLSRQEEQAIWDKIYHGSPDVEPDPDVEKEPWASGAVEIIPMPPDSSCFYHSFYECIKNFMTGPMADSKRVCAKYESYERRLHAFIESIDKETYEVPEIEDINHTHILRFIVATNITADDFEEYKILCLGEPENTQYESIETFRTGVLFTNDFANQITIQILMRVFDGLFGIYIYCKPTAFNTGGLTTSDEWHGKPYNMFLELEDNNHYNVICFKNCGKLLAPRELHAFYRRVA